MTISALNRRDALKLFLKGAGAFALTAQTSLFSPVYASEGPPSSGRASDFGQGLASGDPQPDSIVLWTRAEPSDGKGGKIPVRLQVSTLEDFSEVIADQVVEVGPDSDYCARALLNGLSPDTVFFYRFGAGAKWTTHVGRTRTAPLPDADRQVRFAFASCQDYKERYFGAWRRMVEDDKLKPAEEQLDFVLHLGDFIYEGAKEFGTGVRQLPPLPSGGLKTPSGYIEAVTLDDYRHIYKTVLSDPDLQAARARFAFVSTWDDHEFSNNGWQDKGTYFSPSRSWPMRKISAHQAWFEFIPALLTGALTQNDIPNSAKNFRATNVDEPKAGLEIGPMDENHQTLAAGSKAAIDSMTIVRTLRFGKHVDLLMSDTRSYRSAPPILDGMSATIVSSRLVKALDAGREDNDGNPADMISHEGKTLANPRKHSAPGTVLGPDQKKWWKASMANSDTTWRIWGNSIPLTPFRMDFSSVTDEVEDGQISSDAWDGFLHERTELMGYLEENNIGNVVSLAGDHHLHAASLISKGDGSGDGLDAPVVTEFVCAGISSFNVFEGAEYLTRKDTKSRPLLVIERPMPDGTIQFVENFNLALLKGMKAAGVAAVSGVKWLAGHFSKLDHNAHLKFVDTNGYGYGLVRVDAQAVNVEIVGTQNPHTNYGLKGAAAQYRARFHVPAQARSGTDDMKPPVMLGPDIEGRPPFPYNNWDA
jgi:alkaline phosphatase D